MKKDSVICFRVNRDLHESLVQIANADRRSLSSMIEMILNNYLSDKKTFPGMEMRRHPRKPVAFPTVISRQDFEQRSKGSIADISLGGARILIPKDFAQNAAINSKGSKFNIIFDLPTESKPVDITCESTRVIENGDNIIVGASFVDAEFNNYKSLQTYLM
ncbi:MAG: PilZ domain-containing protein [Smithella sp.]